MASNPLLTSVYKGFEFDHFQKSFKKVSKIQKGFLPLIYQTKNNNKMSNRQNQINEIITHLNTGGTYQNDVAGYQYVARVDGAMFKYSNGRYKFYTDIKKMAGDVLKSLNTGK